MGRLGTRPLWCALFETMTAAEFHGDCVPTVLWSRDRAQKRERSSDPSSDEGSSENRDYFPASRLFEYKWPLHDEQAEQYFLQEQVAEFLGIRGIQRKYPDLFRRTVDVEEKKYLMSRGVVTEMQSNMGLVALRSEDVVEVMAEDFPSKYQEYMVVVQEREFQNKLRSKIMETRRIASLRVKSESGELGSVRGEAVKEAVEFNRRLAEQRRQLRSSFFDRHTQITQIPRKAPRVQAPPHKSRYPVALIPGQYSDYYHRYTPEELQYLPLNTALKLPEKPPTPPPDTTAELLALEQDLQAHVPHEEDHVYSQTKVQSSGRVCTVCFRGRESNSKGQPENLLQCSQCQGTTHPSCLGMSQEAGQVASTYSWQCLDCKTCCVCSDPGGEEEMVFCDRCDRGYHTFCVDMRGIPEGTWLCMRCCQCASCGTRPGRVTSEIWRHEFINDKFVQTLCLDCSRYFHKGYFCPVCLKVYRNNASDSPMVCCDTCNRWIHTICDNISSERYVQLSHNHLPYKCCLCRGENLMAEKVDTYHKTLHK